MISNPSGWGMCRSSRSRSGSKVMNRSTAWLESLTVGQVRVAGPLQHASQHQEVGLLVVDEQDAGVLPGGGRGGGVGRGAHLVSSGERGAGSTGRIGRGSPAGARPERRAPTRLATRRRGVPSICSASPRRQRQADAGALDARVLEAEPVEGDEEAVDLVGAEPGAGVVDLDAGPRSCRRGARPTSTEPSAWLYLTALETRFSSTCSRRWRSADHGERRRAAAWGPGGSRRRGWRAGRRGRSPRGRPPTASSSSSWRWTCPVSMRAMSSTSLMSARRWSPARLICST